MRDAKTYAHKSTYELDNGTLSFAVTADDTQGLQGLFSKDHKWFGDGGHFTVWLANGKIRARLQSETDEYQIEGGEVKAGEQQAVAVTFGDGGFKLYVGGKLVDQHRYTGGLQGNQEPIIVGASQWGSAEEKSAQITHEFRGEIADVQLYGQALSTGAIRELADPQPNPQPNPQPQPGKNSVPEPSGAFDTVALDGGEQVKLDLWMMFSDADAEDGERLDYTLKSAPDFVRVSDNGRWLLVEPDKNDEGNYNLQIVASDGKSTSKPLVARVEVGDQVDPQPNPQPNPNPNPNPQPGNSAPTIEKQLGKFSVGEGGKKSFDLDSFFSDADGDNFDFLLRDAPDFVSIVGNKLVVAPKDGDDGGFALSVLASDGEDRSAPMKVDFTVADTIRADDGGYVGEQVGLKAVPGILENKVGTQEWGEGVTLTGYDLNGKVARVAYSEQFQDHTIGVAGPGSRWNGQIDYYENAGNRSEKLAIDFGGDVDGLVVWIGMLGATEGPGKTPETGRWTAYDDGKMVDSGLIGPQESALGAGKKKGGYGIYPIEIDPDGAIDRVVIEATQFDYGKGDSETKSYGENNSDFGIMEVEFLRLEPVDDFWL